MLKSVRFIIRSPQLRLSIASFRFAKIKMITFRRAEKDQIRIVFCVTSPPLPPPHLMRVNRMKRPRYNELAWLHIQRHLTKDQCVAP